MTRELIGNAHGDGTRSNSRKPGRIHTGYRTLRTQPLHQHTALADGRIVATGITTLASVLALRGLTRRPLVINHNAAPAIRPEIHIPAQPGPDTPPKNFRSLRPGPRYPPPQRRRT
ncbi:hypothetical protein [Streptomyces sp. NPDC093097]|uniref:hypothetical protein n=1 Tax=Streptomyces sp. NPDC093097 TaxID=3366027 RepID=UPI00382011EF